uniref:(California timema) hypothetical protein n=1 Tax=Timema californicum TaxID=61474 RepID=A0A7R9JE43_TIMCA|nr:unnamed protein product [Timema californicum]
MFSLALLSALRFRVGQQPHGVNIRSDNNRPRLYSPRLPIRRWSATTSRQHTTDRVVRPPDIKRRFPLANATICLTERESTGRGNRGEYLQRRGARYHHRGVLERVYGTVIQHMHRQKQRQQHDGEQGRRHLGMGETSNCQHALHRVPVSRPHTTAEEQPSVGKGWTEIRVAMDLPKDNRQI